MATDEVEITSLYAGLYRTVIRLGLLIAAALLLAAFSFYLSRETGTDWFTRSGAVMALVGAAVTLGSAISISAHLRRLSKNVACGI